VFASLSLPLLIVIFGGAASAVWVSGTRLSDTTDVLSKRFGFGEAFGGLILLAVATNLPEIAITASAALSGELGIAVGNILGGIALQTVVLVALDAFGIGAAAPLTFRAATLILVLEGVLVMAVLVLVIMTAQLPKTLTIGPVEPGAVAIVLAWGAGLWLLGKARTDLPWQEKGAAPESQDRKTDADKDQKRGETSTARTIVVFTTAALVTLAGGVVLERSGNLIAGDVGMSGVLFAATVLAAATALPELSTGLAAVRIGDVQLAVSDIFGGNAFLPVLFLEAGLISGTAVLPQAQPSDLYLAGLGALLTAVYVFGLIFRPRRQVWRLGFDSWIVLLLYVVGIVGLVAIARS